MAYNAAAQAYGDKIMNDFQASMSDDIKKDWETTYPDATQRYDMLKTTAFSGAANNANTKYNTLEWDAGDIAEKAITAKNNVAILENGGGDKKDYKALGFEGDFVPVNDYTEKGGIFKRNEVQKQGLQSKFDGIQGTDAASIAAKEDYASRIEAIKSVSAEQKNLASGYDADYTKCTDEMALAKAEAELASAFVGGKEDAINAAATEYAKLNVAYFDKYEANQPVNSQADAEARADRAAEIQSYKEMLGMSELAKTTEASVEKTETSVSKTETKVDTPEQPKTVETSEVKTETVETTVEDKEVKAESKEPVQVEINDATSKNDKPNPYAFEKPPQPSGMPSSAYEAMCKQQEEAHIREVNEKVADEIWNSGKWGNGQERIDKLTEAGYDVAGVQAAVTEKISKMNEASAVKTVNTPVAETVNKTADKTVTEPAVSNNSDKKPEVTITHDDKNHVNIKSWIDENGNKITERYYDETRGLNCQRFGREVECSNGSKYEIGYSLGGNKESEVYTKPDGTSRVSRWTDGNKKSVEYFDANGKATSGQIYDGSSEERLVRDYEIVGGSRISTDYDKDGKSTRSVCGPDGSLQSTTVKDPKADKTIETTYNKDGFKDIETTYKGTAQGYSKKPLQVVKYDGTEAENKIADTIYDLESNTKVEHTYDKNGKETSEEIIDMGETSAESASFSSKSDEKSEKTTKKNTRKSLTDDKTVNDDKTIKRKEKGNEEKDANQNIDYDNNGSIYNNMPANPYLDMSTVKKFNPYVNEPAFDATVDVKPTELGVDVKPTELGVDVKPTELGVDVPKFDATVDIKVDPYIHDDKPKSNKTKASRFDSAVNMDTPASSGKQTETGYGADCD